MKKYLPYIIIAVVVLAGVITFLLLQNKGTGDQAKGAANESSKAANKYTDACKLFTKEDLGEALGGTFGDGEEEYASSTAAPGSSDYEELIGSACRFEQENDGTTADMTASLGLAVTINNYRTAEDAAAYMDGLRNPQTAEGQAAVDGSITVEGVGDEAFFVRLSTADGVSDKTESLNARFGKQVIVLTATRLDGIDRSAVQSRMTTLAQKL